jgi:hypothetical protein
MPESLESILLVNGFLLYSLLVKHHQLGAMLISYHFLYPCLFDIVFKSIIVSEYFVFQFYHKPFDSSQLPFEGLPVLVQNCFTFVFQGGLLLLAVCNIGLYLDQRQITD